MNVGTFLNTIDLSKGLHLQVNHNDGAEQYHIYFFVVEMLQNKINSVSGH